MLTTSLVSCSCQRKVALGSSGFTMPSPSWIDQIEVRCSCGFMVTPMFGLVALLVFSSATLRAHEPAPGLRYELTHTLGGLGQSFRIPGGIESLAVSRDGKHLFAASRRGIYQWNLETRKLVRRIDDFSLNILLSQDGDFLVSAGSNGRLAVWDLEREVKRHEFTPGGGFYNQALALGPAGRYVYSVSQNSRVVRWDLQSGSKVQEANSHSAGVSALCIGNAGASLYSIDRSGVLLEHETSKLTRMRSMQIGGGRGSRSMKLSPSGRSLFVALPSTTIEIDLQRWKITRRFKGGGGVALDSRGAALFVLSGTALLQLRRETGEVVHALRSHTDTRISFAVTPDNRYLFSGGPNEVRIRQWDIANAREVHEPKWHSAKVTTIAVDSQASHVATGDAGGSVLIWDSTSGRELSRYSGHRERVLTLVFSHDARWLFSGGDDGRIVQIDVKSAKPIREFSSRLISDVYSIALTPDGESLWAAGIGTGIVRWNLKEGRITTSVGGDIRWLYKICLVPQENAIIGVSRHGRVTKWNTNTAEQVWQIPTEKRRMDHLLKSAVVTPDGKYLFAKGQLTQFDASTGRLLYKDRGGPGSRWIQTLDQCGNGRWILEVDGENNEVRVWSVKERRLVGRWGTPEGLFAVAASSNGETVVTGHTIHGASVWTMSSGER